MLIILFKRYAHSAGPVTDCSQEAGTDPRKPERDPHQPARDPQKPARDSHKLARDLHNGKKWYKFSTPKCIQKRSKI